MKTVFAILLITLIISPGCRTLKPSKTDTLPEKRKESSESEIYKVYLDQTTWILGYFNVNRLNQPPHYEWFAKGREEYSPQKEVIDKLRAVSFSDINIKIVMGTWCPDSRREVPRFMKVLDEIAFPGDKLQFIGVDDVKIAPIENFETLDIQRVPTFIFYRKNIESGRIIENPATSLEQDMLDILTRNEK